MASSADETGNIQEAAADAPTGSDKRRRTVAKAKPGQKQPAAPKPAPASAKPARRGTAAVVGAAAAGLTAGLLVTLGRKAIVQAPSVAAGDWLEALKVEHQLALSLFDQIKKTKDTQPAKRAILFTQLKHALGKHAFAEENVVYPALRAWGDKADADKLNHDHGYVKQHLYDIENIDNSSPEYLTRIAAFRADLEAHIREEEDAIFPPLHAALGEAGNTTLTAQVNREGFKMA